MVVSVEPAAKKPDEAAKAEQKPEQKAEQKAEAKPPETKPDAAEPAKGTPAGVKP